ncbi:MAG: rhodanese-like domain-containing protein [Deltaproteobacteria bacterium]|nr:rhodanese-like domain-containing protein [Deltaproteobacteria bacterium]
MNTLSQEAAALVAAIYRDNGNPEVSAPWLSEHLDSVHFFDVREPHELEGPLGAVAGVANLPLQALLTKGVPVDRSAPVVLICRSGRRSAQGASALAAAGYEAVASVEGGMLAWTADVEHHANIVEEERHENAKNLQTAIFRTNGVAEVSAAWTAKNLGRFKLVDVREQGEREGPMGLIVQAEHVSLANLLGVADGWGRDQPVVVHCASGGRSARAIQALSQMGFTQVASMEGGMMGWHRIGL